MEYLTLAVGALQTNCYIVFDDDRTGVVIDPGAEPERIIGIIDGKGLDIKYVMLTHVHFDHMMAAGGVCGHTGAQILVPERDGSALSDGSLSLLPPGAPRLEADRFLADGDEVEAGKLRFRALATPGHTPGSCCYLCGSLMFSGDTLFEGCIGRTDFPGGNTGDMYSSLERIKELTGDYTVLPGHGPETTLGRERAANPYLRGF